MTNNRAWIVILLVGALVVIVMAGCGEWLMLRPWGNVVINVISDLFFVVGFSLLVWFLQQRMLAPAHRFFGVDRQTPIRIFISTHEDETLTTREAITVMEYEAADELRNLLRRQFPEFIASWAKLFGIDVDVPEILIKHSPLEKVDTPPRWHSLILVGGPERNTLSHFYLNHCHPWLTFDDEGDKFVERIGEGEEACTRELDHSHKLAMVQKLTCNGTVAIVVFGFGEVGTAAAVRHLADDWKALLQKHGGAPFARLLSVDDLGRVRVEREYH